MSAALSERMRVRVHELEHQVETLSDRVRALQREVATTAGRSRPCTLWQGWVDRLVGQLRGDVYARAVVRENRRVHRHDLHGSTQHGLRV